ncbi:MAG: hypothetical protein GY841_06425 [FCB group bacterium]|nr:hypothetical protein [FCB group bacterium]
MNRRIVIAITFFILFSITPIWAEVPQMINYQGQLNDDLGNPLDTTVSMTFTIYDDSTGGNSKWAESYITVTIINGLFSVLLGSVTSLPDSVFNQPDRWLGISVGGEEILPRTRLASVPYAYQTQSLNLPPTDSPGPCNETTRGSLYYDGSQNEPCYCDGSYWVQLDGGGLCGDVFCADADEDGYDVCDPAEPGDTDGQLADCDDNEPDVFPGNPEVTCDGLDNNCNDATDELCEGSPHVASWECEADTCIITGCETGFFDYNGIFSDGCEGPEPGYCLIDDILYTDGEFKPGSDCMFCDAATNQLDWTPLVCDDDNPCTDDACSPFSGCTYTCDNGNVCMLPNASSACSNCDCIVGYCYDNWANCDGINDNGCELDLIYTPLNWGTAEDLGTLAGDQCDGCSSDSTVSGRGSHWYSVSMSECCSNPLLVFDIGIVVSLSSPAGMDYDLYLWDGSSAVIIDQSNNGAGQVDDVSECVIDNYGVDDSKDYIIEIRANGGSSCQDWTLRIQNCP